MSENNEDRQEDDSLMPLLVIGGAALAAAVIMGKGGSGDDGGDDGNQPRIILSGSAQCSISSPLNAQVHLNWAKNTNDTDFDILENGTTREVQMSVLQWNSNLYNSFQQGSPRTFQIIGNQSQVRSNILTLDIPMCDGGQAAALVTEAVANWS